MLNNIKIFFTFGLFFALFFLLNACGFHIRGQQDIPHQLKTLYIENSHFNSELTPLLKNSLQQLGIMLAKKPTEAAVTLQILQDNFSQNRTALGTAQQLNNIQLTYTVTLVLCDLHGSPLTQPTQLITTTTYLQNANQVLGDSTALPQIQQTLISDMTQKILIYLNTQQVRHRLNQLLHENHP